jgi:hypothetical protein
MELTGIASRDHVTLRVVTTMLLPSRKMGMKEQRDRGPKDIATSARMATIMLSGPEGQVLPPDRIG